ncbi:MAG: phage regulatory CII family protein [Verrucomicrobiales bacterium]
MPATNTAQKRLPDIFAFPSPLYTSGRNQERIPGSGSRNPLDRVIALINSTRDPRIIEWICEQSGGYFVRNPETIDGENYEVMPATSQIVEQFAALLAEISKAAHDDSITTRESQRIRRVWDALKSFAEGFVNCCEDGDFRKMRND